jgi:hypothetical protein
MDYYTYAYLREDRTPYYIGKGKGKRIYYKFKRVKPPQDRSRIIFLKKNLTEEEAFKHEQYMIAILGRKDLGTGILRNVTDGGEGISNPSEETRKKMSEMAKKVQLSRTPEQRSQIARKREANKTPEQQKEIAIKIRESHLRTPPEQRSEIARERQAKKTPEQRSEIARKKWAAMTPEQRSESARKAQASRTPEQRSEIARKRHAAMTPEQRSEIIKKGWETKRVKKSSAS